MINTDMNQFMDCLSYGKELFWEIKRVFLLFNQIWSFWKWTKIKSDYFQHFSDFYNK